MTTNTDFGCLRDPSYNVWVVEAYQNGVRVSRGFVWVGQDIGGLKNYYAKGFSSPATQSLTNNFTCSQGRQPLSLTVGTCGDGAVPHGAELPGRRIAVRHRRALRHEGVPELHRIGHDVHRHVDGHPLVRQSDLFRPRVVHLVPLGGHLDTPRRLRHGRRRADVHHHRQRRRVEPHVRLPRSDAVAFASPYPNVHWYTKDTPGAGAGAPGGPLLLEFKNGITGADVFISGYLERKPH